MVASKSVLLIVGGGVAAYKTLELIRLLRKRGVGVRCVLTSAGAQFVTPLSLAALSGDKVYQDLFSLTDEAEMGHIQLSRAADLVVVAPATAGLMAKAASGGADDLASTTLLATDKPVLMAPAMNVRMWLHPATQRNRDQLLSDGVRFIGPEEGDMACGEFGSGRMAEPDAIASFVFNTLGLHAGATPTLALAATGPLRGRRALVTAGPTLEPIDPVRFLSNRSSGRQGYAIAGALAALGAEVTLVSGPTALEAPEGVLRVQVETAEEMLSACQSALPADVAVLVAAVADWRPASVSPIKLKKAAGAANAIPILENPDILATLSRPGPNRPQLVVGFAAETNHLQANALAKLTSKGCDWIVANDVTQEGVMGGDANAVHVFSAAGIETLPRAAKTLIAEVLAKRIAAALGEAL